LALKDNLVYGFNIAVGYKLSNKATLLLRYNRNFDRFGHQDIPWKALPFGNYADASGVLSYSSRYTQHDWQVILEYDLPVDNFFVELGYALTYALVHQDFRYDLYRSGELTSQYSYYDHWNRYTRVAMLGIGYSIGLSSNFALNSALSYEPFRWVGGVRLRTGLRYNL
jgi:hypothetical protein